MSYTISLFGSNNGGKEEQRNDEMEIQVSDWVPWSHTVGMVTTLCVLAVS